MAAIEYRVFFDNAPAEQEQLDKLEDIIVEQEVDMMWEARVQIPICVDGDGRWEGEDEAWMRAYTRVRIEARIGDNEFAPLIDGPVVRRDAARSNVPGKSMITLIVHDDSVYLTKKEESLRYEDMVDSDIAQQIFSEIPALASAPADIETTDRPSGGLQPVTMQRKTRMDVLRLLAQRQKDFHAYVLPGSQPGQSIGAFRRFTKQTDGLPPMILLGDGKNIKEFNVQNNPEAASDVEAASMSITDKGITTATASYSEREFMTDEPAAGSSGEITKRRLAPGAGDTVDVQSAVRGEVNARGYTATATGSVIPHCYHGVLQPYRVVQVKLSDSNESANYLITKVTHKLTRSTYTQDFSAKGDSISTATGGSPSGPQPSASASASFNVQGSIF